MYVKRVLTSLRLTLFSFNAKSPQDEGRGLQTKALKSKSPWIHKVVQFSTVRAYTIAFRTRALYLLFSLGRVLTAQNEKSQQ